MNAGSQGRLRALQRLERAVAAALMGGLAACATLRGGGAAPCRPVSGALRPGTALEPMAGDFAIRLVATTGPRQGAQVAGALSLTPTSTNPIPSVPEPGVVAVPFTGTATIAVEEVGAQRMGDLASRDPNAPGVAVYEQRSAEGVPTVTMRLGSISNARGELRFDGGFLALYVREIGPGGFAGGWSSGGTGVIAENATGHFCAVRRS